MQKRILLISKGDDRRQQLVKSDSGSCEFADAGPTHLLLSEANPRQIFFQVDGDGIVTFSLSYTVRLVCSSLGLETVLDAG